MQGGTWVVQCVRKDHGRVESSSRQLCTAGLFDWSLGQGQGLTGHNQGQRLLAVNCPEGNVVWNYSGALENGKKVEMGTQVTQATPPLPGCTHLAYAGKETIK